MPPIRLGKNIVLHISALLLLTATVHAQSNIYQNGDGNIGIGTQSPIRTLSVNGGIDVRGPVGYFLDEKRLALLDGTSLVDDPTADGGKAIVKRSIQPSSQMWCGSYTSLAAGNYIVQFRLKVTSNQSTADVLWIDVTTEGGTKILAGRTIKACDFRSPNEWQLFTLLVAIPADMTGIETRGLNFKGGVTDVYLDYINIATGDIRGVYSSEITITPKGYVGIGTDTPTSKLTIQGDATAPVILNVGGSANGHMRVRHIDGKCHDSSDIDNLYIQYQTDCHTILNANGGNVGIGTWPLNHKLAVNGTIRAKEIIVDTGWADDVFSPDYKLDTLAEIKSHIAQKGHLPRVPTTAEVTQKGVSLGETQSIMLRKIEELTLHIIQQQEQMEKMQRTIDQLQSKIQTP